MAVLSLLSLLTPVTRWRCIHLVSELWLRVEACLNMLEATWSWRSDTTTGSRGRSQPSLLGTGVCVHVHIVSTCPLIYIYATWPEQRKDSRISAVPVVSPLSVAVAVFLLSLSRSHSHSHFLSLLDHTISEYLMTTRFLPSACFLFHKCPGLHDNLSQLWKDGQKVYRKRELDKDTQIFYMHTYTPSHVLDVHFHS